MNLKNATLFSIIGISYIFVSRTIAIFFPDILANLMVIRINTLLSLFASLTIVVFYIYFYKDYVQEKQITLKNASLLTIIGSFAVVLLFLKGILILFNLYIFRSHIFNIVAPWISSIFLLYFYIIFHRETLHNLQSKLKLAIFLAVIGSSISTLIRTIMFFNYFYSGKFKWLWDYSREFPVIIIPIFVFMFFTSFYFFVTFYKER
ncbi:MAG: hypothetical protein GQ476_07650 [Candidatus Aminicenantes bacterium]|nr:hypothetical protein [Candidatus Aminicenantes bacterium]